MATYTILIGGKIWACGLYLSEALDVKANVLASDKNAKVNMILEAVDV